MKSKPLMICTNCNHNLSDHNTTGCQHHSKLAVAVAAAVAAIVAIAIVAVAAAAVAAAFAVPVAAFMRDAAATARS